MAGISSITGYAGSKLAVLEEYLGSLGRAAVAFSGGVDSAFLLKVAHNILGRKGIRRNKGILQRNGDTAFYLQSG